MSERLDKIRKRISPEVKERVDRDIQIIDTAISDYKSRLKKEIERAIIEVDEDLKFWSRHPGRGEATRLGRKNALAWVLSLIDKTE